MRQEHCEIVPDFAVLWMAPRCSEAEERENQQVPQSVDVFEQEPRTDEK